VSAHNAAEPNEPLAELGVAPGQTDSANESNRIGTNRQ
jgi:hypothetical protein